MCDEQSPVRQRDVNIRCEKSSFELLEGCPRDSQSIQSMVVVLAYAPEVEVIPYF